MLANLSKIITKSEEVLLQNIANSENRKESFYLLYSEFCLRSKDNIDYYNILNNSDYVGVDGKGIIWALNTLNNFEIQIKDGVAKRPKNNIFTFVIVYIGNVLSAINFIFLQKQTQTSNGTNLILGRNLTYSLLNLAQTKKWNVLIVGGGELDIVKQNVLKKYPDLCLEFVGFPVDSIVMKDGLNFDNLNRTNLFEVFPELILVMAKVSQFNPDLILVGLGGTSGKQEFLIEELKKDEEIDFGLAVGIGAALDHLGGGKQQKEAPKFLQQNGLEFVWRVFNHPYRIKRIIDSVFGLIQLVSEEMLESNDLDEKS